MSISERRKLQTPKKSKRLSHYSKSYDDGDYEHNEHDEDLEILKLTEKIQEMKLLRQRQPNPMKKYSEMNKLKIESAQKNESMKHQASKRRLYHPNLDSIFVGVAHSPYLTEPEKVYSKDTIRTSNALRQLNRAGKPLKKMSDLPFDLQKSKETFVEALTYAPSFEVISAFMTCIDLK
jgi:hypothetical protein